MADVTGVQVEDHFDLENGGGGTLILFMNKSTILLYAVCIHRSKGYKGVGDEGLNPLTKESSEFKIYILM